MDKPYVVFCDFDGTISIGDVGEMLLEHFLGSRWRELDDKYHAGEYGMPELYERSFQGIHACEDDFERFLEGSAIDPSFAPFVEACRESSVPISVVSDGFDFYILRLLDRHALGGLQVISNGLIFENGSRTLVFPNRHEECAACANCKQKLVRNAAKIHRVIYVGNGLSDCCAAKDAHIVYAKDSLAAHFADEGLPFEPYASFDDVLRDLYNKDIL
ncbi:MAG: MtnX-like HAD-IB family phosphatase [Candidatus Aquicultorales bacterium]